MKFFKTFLASEGCRPTRNPDPEGNMGPKHGFFVFSRPLTAYKAVSLAENTEIIIIGGVRENINADFTICGRNSQKK